jgi:hypothetical protein
MMGGVPGQFGPDGSIGIGATSDGVYLPTALGGDGGIHLTTAYGVRGAFNHNWDPYWSSSLFGGAGWVKYDGTAAAYYCTAFLGSHTPVAGSGYSCDPNYSIGMVGVVTRWTPVKNLTFSAETIYTMLHQNFSGAATFSPGAPQPTAAYSFHDQSTLSFNIRAQRNF